MTRLILFLISLISIISCESGELQAEIKSNHSKISNDQEFLLEITIASNQELEIGIHESLKDSFMLSSPGNPCETPAFILSERTSNLITTIVGPGKPIKKILTGTLKKMVSQNVWVLDFGELGQICTQLSNRHIDFGVTFFEGESPNMSFRDHDVYVGHITLDIIDN